MLSVDRTKTHAGLRLRQGALGYASASLASGGSLPQIPPLHTAPESALQLDEEKLLAVQPFRMLSAIYIPSHCTDLATEGPKLFTEDSIKLFDNVTLYANHGDGFWSPPKAERWLGKAVSARLGDKPVLGADADFRVSMEQDNHLYGGAIVRGLRFSPPAVDSCSVTVWFKLRRSHPDLDDFEFYWKLGQVVDGQIVRFIVERIERISECSFVYAGADPLARSLSLAEARDSWARLAAAASSVQVPAAAGQAALAPTAPAPVLPSPSPSVAMQLNAPVAPALAPAVAQNGASMSSTYTEDNPRFRSLWMLYEIGEVLAMADELAEIAGPLNVGDGLEQGLAALSAIAKQLLTDAGSKDTPESAEEPEADDGEEGEADDATDEGDKDAALASTQNAFAAAKTHRERGLALKQDARRQRQLKHRREASLLYRFNQARFGKSSAAELVNAITALAVKAEAQPAAAPPKSPKVRRAELLAEAKSKKIPPVVLLGADTMPLSLLESLVANHQGVTAAKAPTGRRFAASATPGGAGRAVRELSGDTAPKSVKDVELTAEDLQHARAMGLSAERMKQVKLSMLTTNPAQLARGVSVNSGAVGDPDDDDDSDDE